MAARGLYQPLIQDRNVRRLYRLKVQLQTRTGGRVHMTTLLNQILDEFFAQERVTLGGDAQDTVPRPQPATIPTLT